MYSLLDRILEIYDSICVFLFKMTRILNISLIQLLLLFLVLIILIYIIIEI